MSKTKNRYNTKEFEKTPKSIIKNKKYKMSEEEKLHDLEELTEIKKNDKETPRY